MLKTDGPAHNKPRDPSTRPPRIIKYSYRSRQAPRTRKIDVVLPAHHRLWLKTAARRNRSSMVGIIRALIEVAIEEDARGAWKLSGVRNPVKTSTVLPRPDVLVAVTSTSTASPSDVTNRKS